MNNSVIAGPYRLIKTSKQDNSKYEEVCTFCIMEDCSTSERYYRDGKIDPTKQAVKKHEDLNKAILFAIQRLENLMQAEKFNPLDHTDARTLRALIDNMVAPQSTIKQVAPIIPPIVHATPVTVPNIILPKMPKKPKVAKKVAADSTSASSQGSSTPRAGLFCAKK